MVFDDLSVRVTANTRDFESGMEDSRDELNQTVATTQVATGAFQTLQNRVNELGDELDRTKRKTSSLNRSTTLLTGSISALSVSIAGFNTTQLAGMITGFGTLATTIAPLSASLLGLASAAGGVAAGFSAVIGTGIFAFGEQLASQNQERLTQLKSQREELVEMREAEGELNDAQQRRLNNLNKEIEAVKETTTVTGALSQALEPAKEQLRESARAIGEEFIPLIRDGIDALPAFIRQIEQSVGDLQPFADALRDAGEVAFNVLPEMVSFFLDLGREALPTVREFGRWLANNWRSIIETSVETLRTLSSQFRNFLAAVMDLLGPTNQLGITVLETVLPALTGFVNALSDVIETVQNNAQIIKTVLVGSFIALTGPLGAAITLLFKFRDTVAKSLGRLNTQFIQPFIEGFTSAFDNKFQEVLSETGETLAIFIESLSNLLGLDGDVEDWGETAAEALNGVQEALITVNDLLQGDISFSEVFDFGNVGSGGMGQLTTTFEKLSKLGSDIRQQIQPGIESLQRAFQRAMPAFRRVADALQGTFSGIMDFVNNTFLPITRQALTQFIIPLFNDLAAVFNKQLKPTVDEIAQNITAINRRYRALGNFVASVWKEIDHVVVPIIKRVGKFLRKNFVASLDSLFEALQAVMNIAQGDFGEAMENLEDIFDNVLARTFDFIDLIRDGLTAAGDWLAGDGRKIATDALSALPGIIVDLLSASGGFLADALVSIGGWVASNGVSFLKNNLSDFVDAFATLLSAGGGFLAEALKDLGKWIANSPQVLTDLAADIGEAIKDAVVDGFQEAMSIVDPSQLLPGAGSAGPGDPARITGTRGSVTVPDKRNAPDIESGATGGFISRGGVMRVHEGERLVPEAQVSDRGTVQVESAPSQMEVVIESDTEMVEEMIENVTVRKIDEQKRRNKRQSGNVTQL